MRAPKCRLCQKEHYGPCYVKAGSERVNPVSSERNLKPINHDRKRVLLRNDANDPGSLRQVSRPKLAQDKAGVAKGSKEGGQGSSVVGEKRKPGRPPSDTGPTFDKLAYQREYMKRYRLKKKQMKEAM